jgi:drug/metabolite transporter (DMT)-like permease
VSRRGWVLFGAMCVIWGVPYLLIKVAVEDLSPSTVVFLRTGLAAVLLLPIALARGQLRGLSAAWLPLVAYTLVEICGPFLLLGYAETRLSSSITGLLIAAVPIVGAVLGRVTGAREPLHGRRLGGLLLGVMGVAALVGLDIATDDLIAVLAVGGVVLGYSVGPIILDRRLSDLPGLGVVASSLAIAALVNAPAGLAQLPSRWPAGKVTAAVLVLAVVCTAVAFLIFLQLVAEIGPARATVITYVNPAVAVLLGVVLLDERFTVVTGVGFVLVLAGSVLATSPSRTPATLPEPAPAAS